MIPFLAVQLISVIFFQAMGKPVRAIILNLAQGALLCEACAAGKGVPLSARALQALRWMRDD